MCRWLEISLIDSYLSELRYMRGLGSKWREKYARRGLARSANPTFRTYQLIVLGMQGGTL